MSKPSSKSLPIMCTNGSKDDKHGPNEKFNCEENDKYCFPDSYKYCKELTTKQIIFLIILGIVALALIGILRTIIENIPLLGTFAVLGINLIIIAIFVFILYAVYTNLRIHKTEK